MRRTGGHQRGTPVAAYGEDPMAAATFSPPDAKEAGPKARLSV
jgi:hypothetical protein